MSNLLKVFRIRSWRGPTSSVWQAPPTRSSSLPSPLSPFLLRHYSSGRHTSGRKGFNSDGDSSFDQLQNGEGVVHSSGEIVPDFETKGMSREEFRECGKKMIDYIVDYLETVRERRVTPDVKPGYLKALIPINAPMKRETFEAIIEDFDKLIMPGIAHWQHPHFNAYFPAGCSFPSILGDMLSDSLGVVGFSWESCPALTELEMVMLEWLGKMIGLPKEFLPLTKDGKGGGVIQTSASECNLVALLAARFDAIARLKKLYPDEEDQILNQRLISYTSDEAHSSVLKGSKIAMTKMRVLETDDRFRLRGDTVKKAIEEDRAKGLTPFFLSATLGTTATCSFDDLTEIGPICKDNNMWLHVDSAYAGSAMICSEHRYHMQGIEYADSFNMNPHKWLLVHTDCSTMWVQDRQKLLQALIVDPIYLQHNHFENKAIDLLNWGIPFSRTFRSLKLWFVIRMYGVSGLQSYIREHCRLAKIMESLLLKSGSFEIINDVVLGLICFRMKGSDDLNRQLLRYLNSSGRIHMVPAIVKDQFVIRFCVTTENACEGDMQDAYAMIDEAAQHIRRQNSFVPA